MVQALIAEMYVDIQAATALCWQVTARCDAMETAETGAGACAFGRRRHNVLLDEQPGSRPRAVVHGEWQLHLE